MEPTLQKGGMASQGHATGQRQQQQHGPSRFVQAHSTTAHPPVGACQLGDVRPVAAKGGTEKWVGLYSELHLLWEEVVHLEPQSQGKDPERLQGALAKGQTE